jgi:hypothetical protein
MGDEKNATLHYTTCAVTSILQNALKTKMFGSSILSDSSRLLLSHLFVSVHQIGNILFGIKIAGQYYVQSAMSASSRMTNLGNHKQAASKNIAMERFRKEATNYFHVIQTTIKGEMSGT